MTAPNLSDVERRARSDRMKARNADPAFQVKRRGGKGGWTAEKRVAAAERMRRQKADPEFVAAQNAARRTYKMPPLKLPKGNVPVVRGLFVGMNKERATFGDVSTRSGIAYDTIRNWRTRAPHVDLLEAALNTLDLELAIVPIGSRDENGFVRKRAYVRRAGSGEGA